MRLTLLLISEDMVMQTLWRNKRATISEIQKNWRYKPRPTLKGLQQLLTGLINNKFVVECQKKGVTMYAPHPSKQRSIRFRANYDLVGYFDGTMQQLDRFVETHDVEGMTVHDGLQGLGSSLLYPHLVRNYYEVTYPRAVFNTLELDEKFAENYVAQQRSRLGKFLILGHSKLKKTKKVIFVTVAKDIAKVRNIKRVDPNRIVLDKSIPLHQYSSL